MIDLSINPEQESQKIIDFIRSALHKTPFNKLLIGLSGGVDSATVATLSLKALGVQNIYIIHLPYGELISPGLSFSKLLLKQLNIPEEHITNIDIKPIVDQIISLDQNMDIIRRGNIMARVRMIELFDLSKKHKAMVCGTENKTEHLLGYFTRFGDEASDIEPIRHLYKTQVKQLASFLGIPEDIINAPPSAGLWPGQTDEGEFGFSYEAADQILNLFFDQKCTKEEIINKGFSQDLMEKVLKRVEDNKFKHTLPYTLKAK